MDRKLPLLFLMVGLVSVSVVDTQLFELRVPRFGTFLNRITNTTFGKPFLHHFVIIQSFFIFFYVIVPFYVHYMYMPDFPILIIYYCKHITIKSTLIFLKEYF